MITDSSALLAVFLKEPNHERLLVALSGSPFAVPAPVVTEVALRQIGRGLTESDCRAFISYLLDLGGTVQELTEDMAYRANGAVERFGKGRGHPAQLNFGDCLVYGVASVKGLPLLFKGQDFQHTDLVLHPASQDGKGQTLEHMNR